MARPSQSAPLAAPKLARVRTVAQDAMRGARWWTLLDLERTLRADAEFWRDLWAPSLSIAAHKVGLKGARSRLDEAIEAGFHQTDLFEPELSAAFGADPDWGLVLERARANVPAAPLRITAWPEAAAAVPLRLDRAEPHREPQLLARLPRPAAGAWETATSLLAWTSALWRHANARINAGDALDVLEQVALGARYSCVEYSIVLAQGLNAVRIPARRVWLRRGDYHDGVGQGHAVAEAWIDDLDRWVLLDGQHGAYWAGEDGSPLGLREIQARERPARPVHVGPRNAIQDPGLWWAYFAHASVTGAAWAPEGFVPLFQDGQVLPTERLLRSAADAYPRLSDVAVAVVSAEGAPAVRIEASHPYAVGGAWDGEPIAAPPGPHAAERRFTRVLDRSPGGHRAELAAVTPYGTLTTRTLEWTAA
ncbi:transglutaminase-like domain-containing protein [Glycomyces paridis]|uniref:Transglutaminase domain-containing protein n=1 Tax=Glycomyces paridis TaxID=2126555 RepID=A0A4S8PE08_9ACTN|nr:transglutaminase-like domain-containing protein [Glycomyces paridis]THV28610.1 transglutaminase domain-containing protein [Glycomyces paridis]